MLLRHQQDECKDRYQEDEESDTEESETGEWEADELEINEPEVSEIEEPEMEKPKVDEIEFVGIPEAGRPRKREYVREILHFDKPVPVPKPEARKPSILETMRLDLKPEFRRLSKKYSILETLQLNEPAPVLKKQVIRKLKSRIQEIPSAQKRIKLNREVKMQIPDIKEENLELKYGKTYVNRRKESQQKPKILPVVIEHRKLRSETTR